jgi:probable blue pigment (indigoidine) exporter
MRSPVLVITALTPAIWGTTYAVTTQFLPPGRPLLAGVLRALPAGLLLITLTRRLPRGVWWWRSAVLGALNIGLFFAMLFVSAYRLPGGMAAVLGAAQPLVVAGLTGLLLTERVALRTVLAALTGAAGVALAVLTAAARLDPFGLLAGLIGTSSMALGLVLTKRWGRPGVSLLTSTGWQLTAGGLLLAPVALAVEGPLPALTSANLAGYAYLSVVGTAMAYSIWFWGLERLQAARVSLLGLLSPLVATVVGWVALGQDLAPAQVGGMMLAFGAVVWGQRTSAKVRVLDDMVGEAGASRLQHRPAEPVGGGDIFGQHALDQGEEGRRGGIDGVVEPGLRPRTVGGPDDPGPEGISVGQQGDDVPLGSALDSRPHPAAVGIGAGARHIDEGDLRADLGKHAGSGHRVVVGDDAVFGLVESHRRDTQAIEAGVGTGQIVPDRRQVAEIGQPDLPQLAMPHPGRRPDDGDDLLDVGSEQTLAQHTLADHAGRTEDDDLHRCSLALSSLTPGQHADDDGRRRPSPLDHWPSPGEAHPGCSIP